MKFKFGDIVKNRRGEDFFVTDVLQLYTIDPETDEKRPVNPADYLILGRNEHGYPFVSYAYDLEMVCEESNPARLCYGCRYEDYCCGFVELQDVICLEDLK